MPTRTALIVDDQKMFQDAVAFELELLGFETSVADDGKQGFDAAKSGNYSIIVSDIRMPNWDGSKFLQEYRKIAPTYPPFIMMTGFADISEQDAFNMGADAFLGKPLHPEKFSTAINSLLTPLESQFDQTITGNVVASLSGNSSVIELGRRGFFYSGLFSPGTIKAGDLVSFDFNDLSPKLPFPNLVGLGCVRWVRNSDTDSYPKGLGVEILNISSPTPKSLSDYTNVTGCIAVIPIGDINKN